MLSVGVCACHRSDVSARALDHAERLVKQAQWAGAVPLLKEQLLAHPRDAAAHFYLGRCYLNMKPPVLGAATGEFEAALALFREGGGKSPIPEFADRYFELRCYLEITKVCLRRLEWATSLGASSSAIHRLIRECQKAADDARRVAPDAPEVRQLQDIIDNILHPPAAPSPPQAPRPEWPVAA